MHVNHNLPYQNIFQHKKITTIHTPKVQILSNTQDLHNPESITPGHIFESKEQPIKFRQVYWFPVLLFSSPSRVCSGRHEMALHFNLVKFILAVAVVFVLVQILITLHFSSKDWPDDHPIQGRRHIDDFHERIRSHVGLRDKPLREVRKPLMFWNYIKFFYGQRR